MNKWLKQDLWRHVVGIIICLFALFPLYLVIISSFSSSGSLQLSSFLPREISFANYNKLFNDPTIPYLTWVKNSLLIAGSVAVFSVMIGTASAFAFSRLKFKGRKFGIQLLLLVQMFPAILAISAVYVIMERVYKFAPEIGLGTQPGLLLVYLGGAMGVNIWLLKGFVDSIPAELDEAAKIDGASEVQTFWLIFVPLASPVLAVVALLSFIGTFNEFILARLFLVDMESRTVAVGLQQQLARALGQVVELMGEAVLLDVTAQQPNLLALDPAVRVLQRHVAVAQALHFAAGQDDAALQGFQHQVIMARTAIVGDHLFVLRGVLGVGLVVFSLLGHPCRIACPRHKRNRLPAQSVYGGGVALGQPGRTSVEGPKLPSGLGLKLPSWPSTGEPLDRTADLPKICCKLTCRSRQL